MGRLCPLLERSTPSRILHYAPNPWVLRECLKTGFVWLENPPDYDSFKEDFAWEVTSRRESEKRQQSEPIHYAFSQALKRISGQHSNRNKVRDLALDCLAVSSGGGRKNLLDLGCGWGNLLPELISLLPKGIQEDCVPYGVEISTQLAHIADGKLQALGGYVIHDNALSGISTFRDGFFNIIIMSSFLEHELNPLPLLRECRTKLQDNGRIVVKVPNYGSVNRIIRRDRWCGFRFPDHVNYFRPNTLRATACAADLCVERMNLMDRFPSSDSLYAVFKHQ